MDKERQVQQVLAEYVHAADRRDAIAMSSLFVGAAFVEVCEDQQAPRQIGLVEGASAIGAAFAGLMKPHPAGGIRVNAVSPGPIRTGLGGGLTPAFEALLASRTALGRVGEPDDVGRLIATLLSDAGNWINGQSIEVAGGYVV